MILRDIKRTCFTSPYIDEEDAEIMFDFVSRGFNVLIPSFSLSRLKEVENF